MSGEKTAGPVPAVPAARLDRWVLVAAAVVVAILAGGMFGAFRIVAVERERDQRSLALRLGSTADARASAVGDWTMRQAEAAKGLAENQTIQLFLTELAMVGGDRGQVTDEASQVTYVRSLLAVAAERLGYVAPRTGVAVNANLQRGANAGIGFTVLDATLRPLLSTAESPALEGRLLALAEAALKGPVSDMVPGPGGHALFVAAAPVTAIQGETGAPPVGVLFGLRDAEPELFQLLDRPRMAERSAETLLLRRAGAVVEVMSPMRDGTRPFARRIAMQPADVAEVFAVQAGTGFAILRDVADREVVVASQLVPGMADWTVALKVARAEALGESDSRLRQLLTLLLLGTGVLAAGLVAVWRHGASRRASAAAQVAQDMARRFEAQSALLRLVTDSQLARIFIVADGGRVSFVNRRLSEDLGEDGAAIEGKRLGAVFGPAGARRYEDALRTVLQKRKAHGVVERTETDGRLKVINAEYIPVKNEDGTVSMLVVEEDITEAVVERETRARNLQELVEVLVRLVDRRDPYAANHSKRVAAIAREIAAELDLPDQLVEATETAGRLMNLGKAMVPEALLTKTGRLSDEEHAQVRDALSHGIDMLENIEFGGPVVDTLRQAQERWDGTGPLGLAGEAILMPARIIAVANAFVAMTSARAHRSAAGIDEAMAVVQKDAGRLVDRRVVAALVNIIENRGGRTRFAA